MAAILDFKVAIVTESVIPQTGILYQNVQNYLFFYFVVFKYTKFVMTTELFAKNTNLRWPFWI